MRRIGLAALTALFATSGLAVAAHGGPLDTLAKQKSWETPWETPEEYAEAVVFEAPKQVTIDGAGDQGTLASDERTISYRSNVNAGIIETER